LLLLPTFEVHFTHGYFCGFSLKFLEKSIKFKNKLSSMDDFYIEMQDVLKEFSSQAQRSNGVVNLEKLVLRFRGDVNSIQVTWLFFTIWILQQQSAG
jgi:hypothetical protein